MNRLRALREEKGMKQSELGRLLNLEDAAISKYESEKVLMRSDTLIELSKIFNVSIDYILGNDIQENPLSNNTNANTMSISPLDREILKRFHKADTFDQVAILRILNIKEKETTLQNAN